MSVTAVEKNLVTINCLTNYKSFQTKYFCEGCASFTQFMKVERCHLGQHFVCIVTSDMDALIEVRDTSGLDEYPLALVLQDAVQVGFMFLFGRSGCIDADRYGTHERDLISTW